MPGYRLHLLDGSTADLVAGAARGEGAGDFLPPYAGNLDIMTAAAARVGEQLAQQLTGSVEVTA